MKNILIGKADIRTLLSGNYIYVDKTEYIYNLVNKPDIYFLSRPRRFGKSLLVSTFIEIFSGNKELFKDCWIYKNTNYDWKKYPIIYLDFAEISNMNTDIFKKGLIKKFYEIANNYEINLIESKEIKELIKELLKKLYERYNEKVVILIDEYDEPILDNIDNLEVGKENTISMYDMYVVMKSNSQYIHFEFVTGITRFAKTSLFSGPNNLQSLSMKSEYNNLLGYTQEELEFYFNDYINLINEKLKINNKSELLNKIKTYYNGYLFSHENKNLKTVYNPFSILNFFSEMFFNSYWFKTGTPSYLIELLNKYFYDIPKDENNIYLSMYELEKFEIDRINFISLLFQAGYLTIESYNFERKELKLKYPNQEVRDSFIENIESIIKERINDKIREENSNLKMLITSENWEKVFILLKSIFATIPYGFKPNTEYYYSSVFMGILSGAGFQFDAEVHTNDGRIDMVLYANEKIYIIEFKIKQLPSKAINQIEDKKYFTKYLAKEKPILFMGVNFDTDEKNLSSWKVEEFKLENINSN